MTDALARACLPRVLPVATVAELSLAAPLAEALAAGGATAIEVTFRTEAAPRVVAALADSGLVVGAGTIRTFAQLDEALAAGAQFVVSPALDDAIVERCLDAEGAGAPRHRDGDRALARDRPWRAHGEALPC
jgi:2-dehydro-3-deoxyphosphogluconate aldolase/(4S)-4-hydroxy-2-oxoglutarate aldolase